MKSAEDLYRRMTEMAEEDRKQKMQGDTLKGEDGPQSFACVLEEFESKAADQRNSGIENGTVPPSLLTNVVDYTKTTLWKIRQINHDSVNKMDLESRKSLEKAMNQEIKKIDSVLNHLLNYISVSTPVIKANTILTILEEILEVKTEEFYQKGITITKKYESDLPETCIHDEQIKFIVNSIFQYAILSCPLNGRIGLITRSVNIRDAKVNEKIIPTGETEKTHAEIVVVLMDGKQSSTKSEGTLVTGSREKASEIILYLVRDLVQRHRGLIKFEIVEKESMTVIDVKLPICQNQVVAYEPIQM